MGMAKSQSPLCGDEAVRKEASPNDMLKLDFTRADPVKYDCKKTLSEQVQPDNMLSWRESVLAAEAKKAGSASEKTHVSPSGHLLNW